MESHVSCRYSPSRAIPERQLGWGSSQRLKAPDDPQQCIDVDIPVDDHMPPVRSDNVHPTEAAWGMWYRRSRPKAPRTRERPARPGRAQTHPMNQRQAVLLCEPCASCSIESG